MTGNPHDHLVRSIFGRPDRAAAELRAVLPPALLARVDLDTLTPVPGTFVDAKLRDREADLLFTVRGRTGGEWLVYVLLEHQSSVDPWIPLRLLEYQLRIWGRWRSDHPEAARLPRIVPVVLYHGERAWTGSTQFEDLLEELSGADAAELRGLTADFRFLLDDLTRSSDDQLRGRALDAASLLTLLMLKHARSADDLRERLLSWASLMSQVVRAPGGREALALVLRYLSIVSERVGRTFVNEQFVSALEDVATKEATMTLAEEWMQEGKRKLLVRLLQSRFGELPQRAIERLNEATEERIDEWAVGLFDAETLDEALGD
jgi:predicted transposase YdaD